MSKLSTNNVKIIFFFFFFFKAMAYAPKFLGEKALLSNNLGNIKRAIINQLQKEIQNVLRLAKRLILRFGDNIT